MQVIINDIDKTYKDGSSIDHKGSHYAFTASGSFNQIIINLSQMQMHANTNNVSIEHLIIQHTAHETIHKILRNEVSIDACDKFDNIAANKAMKKHNGKIAFNYWFSGFYEGEKKHEY